MAKKKCMDGRRNNRPPAKTQYQPGQSGNKKGRPQKEVSFDTIFEKILNRMNRIKSASGTKRLSTGELLVEKLVSVAMNKGDLKIILYLLGQWKGFLQTREDQFFKSQLPQPEDLSGLSVDELRNLYFETLGESSSRPVYRKEKGGYRQI